MVSETLVVLAIQGQAAGIHRQDSPSEVIIAMKNSFPLKQLIIECFPLIIVGGTSSGLLA